MLIIAGSGRSGTSAVAKLLHAAGISMGHNLIPADAQNPDGYFEDRAVVDANDLILRDAGLTAWFSTASRAQVIEAAHAHAPALRACIAAATPAWKDPRFSWTLEAWLPHMTAPPRIIVCVRSPAEVVASTLSYYGLTGEEPQLAVEHLWRAQYERLLDVIAEYELDATCADYAALHSGDAAAFGALSAFVGFPLDASGVRGELRHHRADVSGELRELYERVRALAPAAPAAPDPGRGARSG